MVINLVDEEYRPIAGMRADSLATPVDDTMALLFRGQYFVYDDTDSESFIQFRRVKVVALPDIGPGKSTAFDLYNNKEFG